MINENGAIAKIYDVRNESGVSKIKFTTIGDKESSAWFSIFEGVGKIPEVGNFVKIRKFIFESVPVKKGSTTEFPVTLKITLWEILES